MEVEERRSLVLPLVSFVLVPYAGREVGIRLDRLCWILACGRISISLQRWKTVRRPRASRRRPQAVMCHFRCAEVLGGPANEHCVRVLSGGAPEPPEELANNSSPATSIRISRSSASTNPKRLTLRQTYFSIVVV